MSTKTNHRFAPCNRWLGTPRLLTTLLLAALLLTSLVGALFAQGIFGAGGAQPKRYDSNNPPPLDLPQAYALAIAHVGTATNRLWCITGSCQADWGTTTMTHWEFGFSNTNRELTKVYVFFDRTACHMVGAEYVSGPLK